MAYNLESRFRKIVIGRKVDLDTGAAAFMRLWGGHYDLLREGLLGKQLLEWILKIPVEVVESRASAEDLDDVAVLCIECGGGEAEGETFDHHGETVVDSATKQAYEHVGFVLDWAPREFPHREVCVAWEGDKWFGRLAEYVNFLDTQGSEALRHRTGEVKFPTLSDVFAGMLLLEREPAKQFHRGLELLWAVLMTDQDPFGTIRGFKAEAAAKAENDRQMRQAVKRAQWATTRGGRKLAYLETEFFGAPGALYGVGAEIAVCFNPRFGQPPVAKFTIAGNGVVVKAALERLSALEEGWGGPATGTILGSPRSGSKLTLKQVVEVVKEAL